MCVCVCFCQTSVDKQELLCGQLAGVARCVSELSLSPVRVLRLRRNKFAVRMKDDFVWVSEHTRGPPAHFKNTFDHWCLIPLGVWKLFEVLFWDVILFNLSGSWLLS